MNFSVAAILALSWCLASTAGASSPEDFKLRIKLTLGERSKDSSSQTTLIIVDRDRVVWEETNSGQRGRRQVSAQRKVFDLSAAERQKLLDAIRANTLLRTGSITLPQRPPVFYFDLRIDLTLGGENGAIAIAGPRSASDLRGNDLYRRSMNVVKELYRVLNAHDASIVFEEPVRSPR